MAGMKRETNFREGSKVWKEYFTSTEYTALNSLSEEQKECSDIDANEGIGCMFDFKDEMNFTLIIGDFVKKGTKLPADVAVRKIPKGMTAHVQIEGKDVADILESAYYLIQEAVEKTGKKIDYDNFYWCEVYTCERYSEPMRRGEHVVIDYIVPVK